MKEIGNALERLYPKGHGAVQAPHSREVSDVVPNTCDCEQLL